MALQTQVLVSCITNLSDARYCAGMGVDLLGFALEPDHPDYVPPEQFREITQWVEGIRLVGEISRAIASDVPDLLAAYPVELLIIQAADNWVALHQTGISLICKVEWKPEYSLTQFEETYGWLKPYVDYFLLTWDAAPEVVFLDTYLPIREIASRYPVLVGFGIDEESAKVWAANDTIRGIALRSSQEAKPGYHDFDQLAAVLEAIETYD